MAKTKRLHWSRVVPGEWHGRLTESAERTASGKASEVLAVAVKTGSHLDDYPWDWYFTDYGTKMMPQVPWPCRDGKDCKHGPRAHMRRHAGVSDTLRAAKQVIEDTLASPEDTEVSAA